MRNPMEKQDKFLIVCPDSDENKVVVGEKEAIKAIKELVNDGCCDAEDCLVYRGSDFQEMTVKSDGIRLTEAEDEDEDY